MALRLLGATGALGLEPTAGVHTLERVGRMPEPARHQRTVPEVVWDSGLCRNSLRHGKARKIERSSFGTKVRSQQIR